MAKQLPPNHLKSQGPLEGFRQNYGKAPNYQARTEIFKSACENNPELAERFKAIRLEFQ